MISLLLFLSMTCEVPTGPVQWSFQARPVEAGQVVVELTAKADAGWHVYATELDGDLGPIPTSIRFDADPNWEPVGGLVEPERAAIWPQETVLNAVSGSPERIEPDPEMRLAS